MATVATPAAQPPSNESAPVPAPAKSAPIEVAVNTSSLSDINNSSATGALLPNKVATHGRANSRAVDPDSEDEDVPAPPSEEEKMQAACTTYFSAYGLTPNQYKWLATNRKKYPTVCPAPLPKMVDYVIIFTHDVDFYNYTMPESVHKEAGGFLDWNPMTMVDTAFVKRSDADKNRHEYVWVFHTKRGAFDPAKFSTKRRPLFEKTESNTIGYHASDRTVEEAIRFIQEHGATP